MADPVQLTDLDVITRYSIAVRSATADRSELVDILRADLAWLERGRSGRSAPVADDQAADEPEEQPAARPAIRRMALPAKRAATKRASTTKKTTAKKAAAKKTATRRSR